MRKILRKTAAAVGVGALLLAAPIYGADNISDLMVYTDNIPVSYTHLTLPTIA